jgi:hypothetical protein
MRERWAHRERGKKEESGKENGVERYIKRGKLKWTEADREKDRKTENEKSLVLVFCFEIGMINEEKKMVAYMGY